MLFFYSSAAPQFVFSSLRRDKNINVYHFMFCVRCIYCDLMSCPPHDTCTVRMSPSGQFVLIFPRTISYLVCIFSLIFFSFHFQFTFSFYGISFTWSSSSFSEYFFINSLCFWEVSLSSLLCFCVLMVDYSLVWFDFPSVSFFITHLCHQLEFVGRKRPKVGSFVGRDCYYRFVLLFLFPLIHHSIGVAQTLKMSGE